MGIFTALGFIFAVVFLGILFPTTSFGALVIYLAANSKAFGDNDFIMLVLLILTTAGFALDCAKNNKVF